MRRSLRHLWLQTDNCYIYRHLVDYHITIEHWAPSSRLQCQRRAASSRALRVSSCVMIWYLKKWAAFAKWNWIELNIEYIKLNWAKYWIHLSFFSIHWIGLHFLLNNLTTGIGVSVAWPSYYKVLLFHALCVCRCRPTICAVCTTTLRLRASTTHSARTTWQTYRNRSACRCTTHA